MNVIKNKLRASLRQDMLNKSMKVALAQSKFDAESVLKHWIERSEIGGEALILGQVRIPSVFSLKHSYQQKVTGPSKKKKMLTQTQLLYCLTQSFRITEL
jgi:hypothetical protein